jgi:hypothetical protein
MFKLKIFDTSDLEAFAGALASDLGRRFPPSSEKRTDKGAQRQLKGILGGLADRALRYHTEHKLGVYRKAKLGNVFKWKLLELGYSEDFATQATQQVITQLAATKAK